MDADVSGSVMDRLARRLPSLTASEGRVARYIEAQPEQALLLSAARLAEHALTSDATVVRTARALGYSGWPDMRRALGAQLTLQTHPEARLATRLKVAANESTAGLIDTVFEEARERLALSRDDIDPSQFERASAALLEARSVFVFGVGVSAFCAGYFTAKLVRQGLRAGHMTGMGFQMADNLLRIDEGDALVLFAPGRTFRELDLAFAEAARVGARTVLFTGRHRHDYDERADAVIRVAGSAGGLTGETLSALVAADALLLALARHRPEGSRVSSKRLNRLRRELRRAQPPLPPTAEDPSRPGRQESA